MINEVFLRLLDQPSAIQIQDRAHFYGIAARLMRDTCQRDRKGAIAGD